MDKSELLKLAEIEDAIAGMRLGPSDELVPIAHLARQRAKAFRRLAESKRALAKEDS